MCFGSPQFSSSNFHSIQIFEFQTPTSPSKLSEDLIQLDTNSSYEIEDFDPLNDNAKPIPNHRSTTLPASVVSLNNPVYPYFQPGQMSHSTTETTTGAAINDDNELLKTYGLDHFTIGQNRGSHSSSSTTTNYSSTTTNFRTSSSASSNYQNAISNWTTFD
jgi:DENN domain-containing protein 1